MAENDFIERRKYARLALRSKITFSVVKPGEVEPFPETFLATGKNIGVEGILFTSDQKLEPGTILNLEISLPYQSQPVNIQGEVRWCNPLKEGEEEKDIYNTGAKFLTIDKNHVLLLIKHICGNLSKDIIERLESDVSEGQ